MGTEEDTTSASAIVTPQIQHIRNPSVFRGEAGEDPNKWLTEYDRVAKYNKWDELFCLANVYFFFDGTAREWFENNEEQLTSWDLLKSELTRTFGDSRRTKKRAEEELNVRAQQHGESTQSYIQGVLRLCQQVNPQMPENERVSHLMKGIAEDFYQALLTKELTTTKDFVKWCQYVEEMKERRINRRKFERLPNVIQMSSISEGTDLVSLIKEIVREEVQRAITPSIGKTEPQLQSIEAIVREEVQEALSPLTRTQEPWTEVRRRPNRAPTNSTNSRRQPARIEPEPRATDLWRTVDNKPVCFHCGRPGHVVRYCRERRAIFDDYRNNRRYNDEPRYGARNDNSRVVDREASPGPARGRSPSRRYRSPSPYRRSSSSPSRHNVEN